MTYNVGMYVYLNNGSCAKDNLKITAASYSPDGSVTGRTNLVIDGQTEYELSVKAKFGDTIKVVVEGTQYIGKGVYFYEPEGGRDVSQSLVGIGEGETKVRAEEEFVFDKDIEMGLRIYKTANETGLPISDITFDIYRVELAEGESLGDNPTDDEVAKYAVEANKAGSIITDETGYGCIGLEKGTYFLVETDAPAGYNKLEEAIAVTVVSSVNDKIEVVYIANEKGVLLPETGGVGTRIFYIAGSIMMLAAVVFLITKKRMK